MLWELSCGLRSVVDLDWENFSLQLHRIVPLGVTFLFAAVPWRDFSVRFFSTLTTRRLHVTGILPEKKPYEVTN